MSPLFQIPLCIFISVLCSIPILGAEKDGQHYCSRQTIKYELAALDLVKNYVTLFGRISKPQIIIQIQLLYIIVNKQTHFRGENSGFIDSELVVEM